jgi:hypothetical protein
MNQEPYEINDSPDELSVQGPGIRIKNETFLARAQEALKAGDRKKAVYWLRKAVGLKG